MNNTNAPVHNPLVQLRDRFQKKELNKSDFVHGIFNELQVLFHFQEYLRNTGTEKVEITTDNIIVHTKSGVRCFLDPLHPYSVSYGYFNAHGIETVETAFSLSMIADTDIIFDIGAQIGTFTTEVAQKRPLATIYTFEPIPSTFELLKNNLNLNDVHAKIFNIGLSNEQSEKVFYLPEDLGNASMLNVSGTDNYSKIPTRTTTLDSFCKENEVPRIDFIKCDVEGAEKLVFEGGISTITTHRPIIFAEMLRKWAKAYGYHPNDLIAWFSKQNYTCFTLDEQGAPVPFAHMEDSTTQTNFWFFHREKHAAIINQLSASSASI